MIQINEMATMLPIVPQVMPTGTTPVMEGGGSAQAGEALPLDGFMALILSQLAVSADAGGLTGAAEPEQSLPLVGNGVPSDPLGDAKHAPVDEAPVMADSALLLALLMSGQPALPAVSAESSGVDATAETLPVSGELLLASLPVMMDVPAGKTSRLANVDPVASAPATAAPDASVVKQPSGLAALADPAAVLAETAAPEPSPESPAGAVSAVDDLLVGMTETLDGPVILGERAAASRAAAGRVAGRATARPKATPPTGSLATHGQPAGQHLAATARQQVEASEVQIAHDRPEPEAHLSAATSYQTGPMAHEAMTRPTPAGTEHTATQDGERPADSLASPMVQSSGSQAAQASPHGVQGPAGAESFDTVLQQMAGRVTEQTAAGVRIALAHDGQQAHLQLQPESLGRLDIHVVMNDTTVQVHVTAEHAQVGQVITAQWTQLRETLAAQGLQVTDLAVSIGMDANPRQLLEQRDSRRTFDRGSAVARTDGVDAGNVSDARPSRHLLEGSSIEYWV